ncbi:MAG TPA: MarR family transcriptional regulator [Myxococcales bacterium]|nr:MarR family transcriptional regulator [Myxococcales bacterium]
MASAGAATVEKALDVLFHLHDAGTALGLSQIGRDLDLPKSSCHRLLATLVNRELVERDDSGQYRLGPGSAFAGDRCSEPRARCACGSADARTRIDRFRGDRIPRWIASWPRRIPRGPAMPNHQGREP